MRTKDLPNWCWWWDQGTGKSKMGIDTACYLYGEGKIDAVIVLAPKGVESNWAIDEFPRHLWDSIIPCIALWDTGKRGTKKHKAMLKEMLEYPGLKVLCISYNGLMTTDGAKLVRGMLRENRCLYIADESDAFKTPDTKTCKRVLASSKLATYRRVMNGTPVEDSPFQAYSQVKFAEPNVWAQLGIHNYGQFKAFFGIFEKRVITVGDKERTYPALVRYQNMDLLHKSMYEYGTRVLKEDVLQDLPAKSYTKVYFDLTSEQRRVYKELREELFAELTAGLEVSAELAIVKLVRFQQITSGFVPADDTKELVRLGKKNPRLDALKMALGAHFGQKIVWAKYTTEIDMIAKLLDEMEISYRIYDGRTSSADRQRHKEDFQAGAYEVFLAKQSAAARGLTLTAATTCIYFSNLFSLGLRKQSEDRAHRIGQHHPVLYIDLVARGTVDEHIIGTLRDKRERSAIVTGDTLRSWV